MSGQDLSKYKRKYYERKIDENWYRLRGLLRPDELAALAYAFGRSYWRTGDYKPRTPKVIYSIGCGVGNLEKKLEEMGCTVYGVDPSPGAQALYQGANLLKEYPGGGDTIIFCESLEHIPSEQIDAIWAKIPTGAHVIVVNWVDFFPIPVDSDWEHITRVDDELFDKLSKGFKTVYRRGGHLVLEKL